MRQQLAAHESLAGASDYDKPLWEQKIAALDRQIDGEVYKLYGLTPEENAIVEGRTGT